MRNFGIVLAAGLASCVTGRFHDSALIGPKQPLAGIAESVGSSETAGIMESADFMALTANPAEPPVIAGRDKGYTRLSVGTFTPDGDISSLDTGWMGQIAFGTDLLPFLAVDASVGYLSAEGSGNSELWGIPLFVNGRAQLPILILEGYAGVGVGGMYADYQVGSFSDDDFVLAGTAFLGLEIGLGNLALGLEYRYLKTEDTDPGFSIEGHAGLLTLTLPF